MDEIKSILGAFFKYDEYIIAIKKLRIATGNGGQYAVYWKTAKEVIRKRDMIPGQPLQLIHIDANLPLDENSDEEAYKWLDLMVENVESADDTIIEY